MDRCRRYDRPYTSLKHRLHHGVCCESPRLVFLLLVAIACFAIDWLRDTILIWARHLLIRCSYGHVISGKMYDPHAIRKPKAMSIGPFRTQSSLASPILQPQPVRKAPCPPLPPRNMDYACFTIASPLLCDSLPASPASQRVFDRESYFCATAPTRCDEAGRVLQTLRLCREHQARSSVCACVCFVYVPLCALCM